MMPGGDRAAQAERGPDRDHGLADAHLLRRAELRRASCPSRRPTSAPRCRRPGCDRRSTPCCACRCWSTISILPSSLAASATTWLLVITWPCLSSTNPEPVAPRGSPSNSAMIWTVLGSTRSATAAMLSLSAGSGAAVRFSTREHATAAVTTVVGDQQCAEDTAADAEQQRERRDHRPHPAREPAARPPRRGGQRNRVLRVGLRVRLRPVAGRSRRSRRRTPVAAPGAGPAAAGPAAGGRSEAACCPRRGACGSGTGADGDVHAWPLLSGWVGSERWSGALQGSCLVVAHGSYFA